MPSAQAAAVDARTGMTVAQARRALADAFRQRRPRHARARRPPSDRATRSVSTTPALAIEADAQRSTGDEARDAGRACRAAARAASRWRASSASRNSGACRCASRRRRWCRGPTPRPWSRRRWRRSTTAARARRALRIADLGTGSGALLLALLSELPNAIGIGTDIEPRRAGDGARDNARRLGLARARAFRRLRFRRGARRRSFDLVVSNPPYIASGDIAALAPEVRHDPRRALDGGADGLDGYRAIAGQAAGLHRPSGHLVVELGIGQEAGGRRAVHARPVLHLAAAHADLSGIPRALCACCHNDAMTTEHCGSAKKHLDYAGENRLASRHGIDPRVMRHSFKPGA